MSPMSTSFLSLVPLRVTFLFLTLLPVTGALYKQWLPDTNFENGANWDKGAVPCGSDRIRFLAHRNVAVYVEMVHAVLEMSLPVDGEFILASAGGFAASDGRDVSCGAGADVTFQDAEPLRWLDPSLWQAAASRDDLEKGRYLFSVHEESVPCRYDDVVFRPSTSFRVDTTCERPSVSVQSVSVLGQRFGADADLSRYLGSRTGHLQFHGSSTVQAGGPHCGDSSGCECGNSGEHERICAAVTCPPTHCNVPLQPTGHCCLVCGAIVSLQVSTAFSLESYRQRLQHLFLSRPPYQSVQMGVSKVSRPLRLLGLVPHGTAAVIQVVLLDGAEGARPVTMAEAVAREIVKDARTQGPNLGIEGAELQASSGQGEGSGGLAGVVAGTVLGVLVLVTGLALLGFLLHRGIIRVPSIPTLPHWKSSGVGDLGGPLDHGFDNPIFDKPLSVPDLPGLYGTEALKAVTMTQSGVHFVNPVYEETDFDS